MFQGRKIAIATMHKKEEVIAPLLINSLQVNVEVPIINTDLLGTFSGEIEREGTLIETARKKCHVAMDMLGCDMAISSEGSFGAHPSMYFTHANEELVLLVDRKNNQEFFGKTLTTETNFSGMYVKSRKEASGFLNRIGFPKHAVIIKDRKETFNIVEKGIHSQTEFDRKLYTLLNSHKEVWVETDMRAMYNPTRMKSIKKATINLIDKLNSTCPECEFPGFWIVEQKSGLPCKYCNLPTKSIKSHIYSCKYCMYTSVKMYPNGSSYEQPKFCDYCNP